MFMAGKEDCGWTVAVFAANERKARAVKMPSGLWHVASLGDLEDLSVMRLMLGQRIRIWTPSHGISYKIVELMSVSCVLSN
jgi:hypothetical protein